MSIDALTWDVISTNISSTIAQFGTEDPAGLLLKLASTFRLESGAELALESCTYLSSTFRQSVSRERTPVFSGAAALSNTPILGFLLRPPQASTSA